MYNSLVPGRIRLRFADREKMTQAAALARSMPGVSEVMVNYRTGSLLIRYDKKLLDCDSLPHLIHGNEYGDGAGRLTKLVTAVSTAIRSPKPMGLGLVKRGMLISLALTVGLAILDREKGHILAGGSFLALLSFHLYKYRRRLFS